MIRSIETILVAAMFVAIAGCKKRSVVISDPGPSAPTTFPAGTATIAGRVTLLGESPIMAIIPNHPCHDGAPQLTEESVVTDSSGHLQNVIVFLENPPVAPPAIGLAPVTLNQINCQYVPHVLALRTGQTLHVTTGDPTLHNVHGSCIDNPAFNFALVAPGQSRDLTFAIPERFAVQCDVHPWMKAHVQVFSHPWFCVTDKQGRYVLRYVPAGTYTLVAWQEKYGLQRQSIVVGNGQEAERNFEFKSGL